MSGKSSYIDNCREQLVATTFNKGPESASDVAEFYGESMPNESGEDIKLWLVDELSQSAITIVEEKLLGDSDAAEDAVHLALVHLRLAADIRGFKPNILYATALTSAIDAMDYHHMHETRDQAIGELGELIIATAQAIKTDPNSIPPDLSISIDEALCDVADLNRENNRVLYEKASALINTPDVIEALERLDHDAFMAEILKHNALLLFEIELAKTNDDFIIDLPWDVIYERALPCTMDSSLWLKKVLDIIVKVKPNYFAKQEDIDFYYGRAVGTVVGVSRRLDIIDAIHATAEFKASKIPLKTTLGFAYGLGLAESEDEFSNLIHSIRERFGDDYADQVEVEYERGLFDSQNL